MPDPDPDPPEAPSFPLRAFLSAALPVLCDAHTAIRCFRELTDPDDEPELVQALVLFAELIWSTLTYCRYAVAIAQQSTPALDAFELEAAVTKLELTWTSLAALLDVLEARGAMDESAHPMVRTMASDLWGHDAEAVLESAIQHLSRVLHAGGLQPCELTKH